MHSTAFTLQHTPVHTSQHARPSIYIFVVYTPQHINTITTPLRIHNTPCTTQCIHFYITCLIYTSQRTDPSKHIPASRLQQVYVSIHISAYISHHILPRILIKHTPHDSIHIPTQISQHTHPSK
jgi:hypothetical protein